MPKVINSNSVLKVGIVLIVAVLLWLISFGTAHAFDYPAPNTIEQKIVFFVVTLASELLVSVIFLHFLRAGRQILKYIIAANIVSFAAIYIIAPIDVLLNWGYLILAALVIFETIFIHYAGGKLLTLRHTIFLSVVMNVLSFFLGGLLLQVV